MTARLLQAKAVARPWGRRDLPHGFAGHERGGEAVGEIWHAPPEGDAAPLLVKHLFSAERLSVQVHPDDAAARAAGLTRGKDEAWLILSAAPDATLGLGLVREVDAGELTAAARSGAIEELVDWRPVAAGDFFFSPAGTIHAIGAGLDLIEIQQNSDTTYRLYDYGRPRELHLEAGLAVADRHPWRAGRDAEPLSARRTILLRDASFVVEAWTLAEPVAIVPAEAVLVIVQEGQGRIDGEALVPGQVWSVDDRAELSPDGALSLLIAYPGAEPMAGLEA